MRVTTDQERCCGAGMCALTAPEVFDQDEETGLVVLLDPTPPTARHAAVRLAAGSCPCAVITLDDTPGPG
ncbi:ferredoxin [Streptomyces mirabilis]|uniref:ferredoxin n=1 Tax=Streptomyces mirabilis TaxID=68239 RepID=UPI002F915C05